VTSVRRSTLSVGLIFFVNGMVFSNWIPRISEVRDRLGVSNSGLGISLLGGGLGGFVGSLLVARIVRRLGSRTVVVVSSIALAGVVPLIAVVPNSVGLLLVLSATGFGDLQADVAVNAQGVMVQTRLGRPIMQRLHGMWSLGTVVGGSTGWVMSALDVSLGWHLLGVSCVMLVGIGWSVRGLLPEDEVHVEAPSANGGRRRALALTVTIGLMGLSVAIIEAVPNEWSSVVLNDVFEAGRWKAAGTAVFATFMLLGRLSGDHVVMRLGSRRTFETGVLMCLGSAILLAVAPATIVAFIAYASWGLGVSVLFPQLYETAAKLPGLSAARGLGAMTFGQRLGFLVAAGAVGAIADLTNFRVTLFGLTAVATAVVLIARRRTSAPAA
jgi:predicted MFS family arabinose efflux permease